MVALLAPPATDASERQRNNDIVMTPGPGDTAPRGLQCCSMISVAIRGLRSREVNNKYCLDIKFYNSIKIRSDNNNNIIIIIIIDDIIIIVRVVNMCRGNIHFYWTRVQKIDSKSPWNPKSMGKETLPGYSSTLK